MLTAWWCWVNGSSSSTSLPVDPEASVAVLEHGVRGIEAAELDVGAVRKGSSSALARGNDRRAARR